ncbi:MAG: F0F1 ATP synthase subunit delta [Gammaproteobacteria bacterium]|nr:F0F1 ATP synthase subunit delta [Gammaproteobacteria bacterium]
MGAREAVARPYARALVAAVGRDLAGAEACLQGAAGAITDPAVAALIANPALGAQALGGAFVSGHGEGCHAVSRLIGVLIDNGRLDYLPEIAKTFAELKDEHEGRVRADVKSARPLDTQQIEALRAALSRRFGKSIVLRVVVDPDLLAGVIVQIGDMILDGSVRGRLRALGRAIGSF